MRWILAARKLAIAERSRRPSGYFRGWIRCAQGGEADPRRIHGIGRRWRNSFASRQAFKPSRTGFATLYQVCLS